MTAREEILERVRAALGRSAGEPPTPLDPPLMRKPRMENDRYLETFVQRLEKLSGKAIVVPDTAAALSCLAPLLEGKRAVASNAPFLAECGITGLPQVDSGITDRDVLREACAHADVGITSADYALARTGTFVMFSSRDEARLVSLLPPLHVAIVPRSRILADLDELLTLVPKPAEQTSSMVFITGPSRTADIEQILVRGVHGPGDVYAIIVENR